MSRTPCFQGESERLWQNSHSHLPTPDLWWWNGGCEGNWNNKWVWWWYASIISRGVSTILSAHHVGQRAACRHKSRTALSWWRRWKTRSEQEGVAAQPHATNGVEKCSSTRQVSLPLSSLSHFDPLPASEQEGVGDVGPANTQRSDVWLWGLLLRSLVLTKDHIAQTTNWQLNASRKLQLKLEKCCEQVDEIVWKVWICFDKITPIPFFMLWWYEEQLSPGKDSGWWRRLHNTVVPNKQQVPVS